MARYRSHPAVSAVVYWLCVAAPMVIVLGPQQPVEVVAVVALALVGAYACGVDRRRIAWIIAILTLGTTDRRPPAPPDPPGSHRCAQIDLIDALIDAGVGPRAPTSALFAA